MSASRKGVQDIARLMVPLHESSITFSCCILTKLDAAHVLPSGICSRALNHTAGKQGSKSRLFCRGRPATKVTPCCLEDTPLRVRGRLTDIEKAKVISLSMKRVDINAACAFATHLKAMNVVAQRGKGVNSPVRHHFVAGFTHAECFLRSVVWSFANNLEIT